MEKINISDLYKSIDAMKQAEAEEKTAKEIKKAGNDALGIHAVKHKKADKTQERG